MNLHVLLSSLLEMEILRPQKSPIELETLEVGPGISALTSPPEDAVCPKDLKPLSEKIKKSFNR